MPVGLVTGLGNEVEAHDELGAAPAAASRTSTAAAECEISGRPRPRPGLSVRGLSAPLVADVETQIAVGPARLELDDARIVVFAIGVYTTTLVTASDTHSAMAASVSACAPWSAANAAAARRASAGAVVSAGNVSFIDIVNARRRRNSRQTRAA